MKKLVTICLTLFSSALFAQNKSSDHSFTYGVRIAGNLANISTDSSSGSSSLIGLAAGVFAELPISGQLYFAPEINYSLKGSKQSLNISVNGINFGLEEKFKLNYISIPLLLKYKFPSSGNFSVFLGPEVSFLVSNKLTATTSANGQSATNSSTFKDQGVSVNTLELGVDLGIQYYFSSHIGVDLRYGLGLTDVTKDLGKNKNSVLQLGVSYKF